MSPALPPPPPLPAPGPVEETGRVRGLDVVRGFAILGLAFVNLPSMASADSYRRVFFQMPPEPPAEGLFRFVIEFFLLEKCIALLAFLLGAGLALQQNRAETGGRSFPILARRRMGILVVLGLLHAVFLWAGDILVVYGLMGLSVCAFEMAGRNPDRKTRPCGPHRPDQLPPAESGGGRHLPRLGSGLVWSSRVSRDGPPRRGADRIANHLAGLVASAVPFWSDGVSLAAHGLRFGNRSHPPNPEMRGMTRLPPSLNPPLPEPDRC